MHLLIDDIRDLYGMDIIARTPTIGLSICSFFGSRITNLYIDHDLGVPKTGYNVIVELLEMQICPPNVQIVSSNPVGVANIKNALLDAGYTMSLNGINFRKEL